MLHTLILLLLLQITPIANAFSDNGSVEHKNNDLHGYLNEISEEQEEKTQILEHI